MIGTIDIQISAAKPNFPLEPVFAFKDSPSNIRIRNVPKRIGQWNITRVYFTTLYPDNQIKSVDCILTGSVYVGTVAGSTLSGKSENGFTVYADGKDENDQEVTGYILGKGDIYILESDGTITPGENKSLVKLLDEQPLNPSKGDVYRDSNGTILMWDGTQWKKPLQKVSELTNDSGYITQSDVPTKTSQLTNDSGYITQSDVPTKTSQLTNDSGFLTSHQSLSNYYKKTQTYSQYQVDTALNGKANVADVPTQTSQLTDGEWITLSGTYDDDTTFSFKVWKQKSIPKVTNNSGRNIYCRINGQPTDIFLENGQSVENVTSLAGGGDNDFGWNLEDSNQNWYYYNQFQNITSDISITYSSKEPI